MRPEPARFLSPLRVEHIEGGRKRLLAPLKFYSADLRGVLVAPAHFDTDYASVPRPFWMLFPKDGPWTRAAVMHDAGYKAMLRTEDGQRVKLIKPLSDRLFLEAMRAVGVNALARRLMYRAVVLFGGRPYGGLSDPVPTPPTAVLVTTQLPSNGSVNA